MKSFTYGFHQKFPPQDPRFWKGPQPRRPAFAGVGRLRKIALLGGADKTLQHAPWFDPTWELWAHASCRHKCHREPDVLFDLHPPELWRDPSKKIWDKTYLKWLAQNHIPIYMQERYRDVPAAIRYPFENIVTEFPRGYMTNHVAYMVALALIEGVTHIGVFGCDYTGRGEYAIQRPCAEYWLGLAEGRGVQVLIPPQSDLLNRPAKLYGYESHPGGVRDPQYNAKEGKDTDTVMAAKPGDKAPKPTEVVFERSGQPMPPLANVGEPSALERRDVWDPEALRALHRAELAKAPTPAPPTA